MAKSFNQQTKQIGTNYKQLHKLNNKARTESQQDVLLIVQLVHGHRVQDSLHGVCRDRGQRQIFATALLQLQLSVHRNMSESVRRLRNVLNGKYRTLI